VLETATTDFAWSTAADIVGAVGAGRTGALSITEATLARIRSRDPLLNSFTAVT
jgi:Asp-tRNA(Asn)/Glu-tRNA(Gln) amidotransferase A subunit family amidase